MQFFLTAGLLLTLSMLAQGCCPPPGRTPATPRTLPSCDHNPGYRELDQKLQTLRNKMLACVGREGSQGHVATTHQCYRGLRLVESARWWLKTLVMPENAIAVYQPAERLRLRFLCAIERLARAEDPGQIERRYVELIRHYP